MSHVKNTGLRTLLSIGAALAVLYFGSTSDDTTGVTNAVLLLAVVVGVTVWFLTKPSTSANR